MYLLEAQESMDAAHFLAGYRGKCGNIHGHRWQVIATVKGEELCKNPQERGMLVDFGRLKEDMKDMVEVFDHKFIVEQGTLKSSTVAALQEEGFLLIWVDFRPTAENFARFFYKELEKKGYRVDMVKVYETPNNCAVYKE